jgi:hypothetical protein
MTVNSQERNKIVADIKGLIEHEKLRAAPRNLEEELLKKPDDYDERIGELDSDYDVFEARYLHDVHHYVFLMDGCVIRVGDKKYHNPVRDPKNVTNLPPPRDYIDRPQMKTETDFPAIDHRHL